MMLQDLRPKAKSLKREIHALFLACRDPRTPWYAKALGFVVIGYALSPIDLIPDFIPVLGYLDDVILLPLGILLFRRLIPAEVLDDCRRTAAEAAEKRCPASRFAAAIIVLVWIGLAVTLTIWIERLWVAHRA